MSINDITTKTATTYEPNPTNISIAARNLYVLILFNMEYLKPLYEGTTDKSASSRYCNQLRQIFLANAAIVATFI